MCEKERKIICRQKRQNYSKIQAVFAKLQVLIDNYRLFF